MPCSDVDGFDDRVTDARGRQAFATNGGAAGAEEDGEAKAGHPPSFESPLPACPSGARELSFAAEQLGALRHALAHWAGEEQLGAAPTEELVLAVNELATNSVRYGGGRGRLLLWRESEALVCEVRDEGHIKDPFTGRSPPAANQHRGRGLWLVYQLCDNVQIHSTAAGTAVRVHKRAMNGTHA
jgi:anti-sigma regulatory factor (Ser/Thr protein kinase)